MQGEVIDAASYLGELALNYASRGFAVFPCSPDNKHPLVGESEPGKGCAVTYKTTKGEGLKLFSFVADTGAHPAKSLKAFLGRGDRNAST